MTSNINPDIIFSARPAAQPGFHAPAGFISSEYDEKIVSQQLKDFVRYEHMSLDELESYKLKKLRELLIEAGTSVPYWRSLFKKLDYEPSEIKTIGEIQELPLLNKNIIKENYKDFISEKVDIETVTYMTTGGSTGSPLKILMDRKYRSRSHAATRYYLMKAGITPGVERGVRLHGNTIPNSSQNEKNYWVVEGSRITMSVSDISMETCSEYMKAIREFKPNYIHAYSSALALLVRYADQLGEKFPSSIKNIFCDSETTYSWQRDLILKSMNARFYNIYGHTEGAGMAITFPDSKNLEAIPVGIMEILDKNGNILKDPDEEGEIVVTGFNNKIMPFIRYQTSDIAVIGASEKTNFRPFRPILSSVKGRVQDYLVTKDESLVPAAPILFDYNFDWTGIDLFQVFQDMPGILEFKIVTSSYINPNKDKLKNRIIIEFSKLFSYKFDIKVSFYDQISTTNRGKYRYVDQRLKVSMLESEL